MPAARVRAARLTMLTLFRKPLKALEWLVRRSTAIIWLRSCDSVGSNTQTFSQPHIENRGRIVIGRNVRINSQWAPVEIASGVHGAVEIEDGVYLNYGTLISAQRLVRIGANVMVGNYSIIADTEIPGIDEPTNRPGFDPRPVEIGNGAWIAARVTVLPGSRIGAGAVIGAGSVVAGEIPPGAIAGGIPARVHKLAAGPSSASEPHQFDDSADRDHR